MYNTYSSPLVSLMWCLFTPGSVWHEYIHNSSVINTMRMHNWMWVHLIQICHKQRNFKGLPPSLFIIQFISVARSVFKYKKLSETCLLHLQTPIQTHVVPVMHWFLFHKCISYYARVRELCSLLVSSHYSWGYNALSNFISRYILYLNLSIQT